MPVWPKRTASATCRCSRRVARFDREGREIVTNYPSFIALLMRDSTRDLSADADLIADGLHMDPKEVRDRIHRLSPPCRSTSPFT